MTVSVGQRVTVDATGRGELAPGTVRRVSDGFVWVDLDAGGFRVLRFSQIVEDSPPPPPPPGFGIQAPAGGFDFLRTGNTAADPLLNPPGLSFSGNPGGMTLLPIGAAAAVAAVFVWLAFR